MPSSRRSSQPRNPTQVFYTIGGFFTIWATRDPKHHERLLLGSRSSVVSSPFLQVSIKSLFPHIYIFRQWHPTPVLLPGKSHGRRSLVGYSPWVAKSWTRLSYFTFTFHFHALEEEMATHSSVIAWRIPGMGEPGGLLSLGSHRVRHNWSDLAAAAACNSTSL